MKQHSGESKRWNLFARELEDRLWEHGQDLGDLVSEVGLHPEKVRRLKQSLVQPRFHILNPEEIEQVSMFFGFTGEEQLRLRAAILATAVEETLMNRIDPENALRAAEEIFPLLVQALQHRYGRRTGLAATRQTERSNDPAATDDLFDPILERFDQAMLALHLSQQSRTDRERLEQATLAQDRFTIVLADLEALSTANPMLTLQDNLWQLWHAEAQKNLATVQADLVLLQE